MILAAGGVLIGWVGLDRTRGRAFHRVPRWSGLTLVGLAPAVVAASVVVLVWPTGTASGPRPASTATIAFATPSSGQSVTGDLLDVRLRVDGATIVERSSTNITPDTGHIHLFLDGELLPMTTGREQQVQVGQLSPGVHRLQAEFVAADHDPFRPRMVTTVVFVKEAA
jgi:hypothetical protein